MCMYIYIPHFLSVHEWTLTMSLPLGYWKQCCNACKSEDIKNSINLRFRKISG